MSRILRYWIDDIREDPDTVHRAYSSPEGWDWIKTSQDAINELDWASREGHCIEEISFDHDLGGDDTSRPVLLWMIENDVWPNRIYVHTANPVGREWLSGMARRYAPAFCEVTG